MLLQLKVQEQFQYLKTSAGLSVMMGAAPSLPALRKSSQQQDQAQISPVTQMAMQYGIDEMDFSSGWTRMKFDKAGDLSARVSHSVNYSRQSESLNLDLTFTAESLGISSDAFKKLGNEPIQLRFDMSQLLVDYKREATLTVQQTRRSAGEIISDIALALREVFRQKGDETVELFLDNEALEALLGDARTSELIGHIVALMNLINRLRQNDEPRNHYQIYVSGKGKPVVDYQEKLDINIKSNQVTIQVTILPPSEKLPEAAADQESTEVTETSAPTPA